MNKAIIVDIDNTLVDSSMLNKYFPQNNSREEWDSFHKLYNLCTLNNWCFDIVKRYADSGVHIIFLTGREARKSSFEYTSYFISSLMKEINCHKYILLMRPDNDFRPDEEVKSNLLESDIINKYDVLFALDDKCENCNLFLKFGIPALKVCG